MYCACVILLLCYLSFPFENTAIQPGDPESEFILAQVRAHLPNICPDFVGCVNGELSPAYDPCCVGCQCGSSSALYHSCCPNSPYIQNISIQYVSQQPGAVCKNTQYSGEPKNVYFSPEYEFIQTCFETTNETTKFYCENIEGKNKSGLVTDHIPVYDPETGVHYGNIHCAKCNMDDTSNVAPWQPKLSCKGETNLEMSIEGLDMVLKENDCELDFVPPSSVTDVRPCFVDVITECNVTGDWIEWDPSDVYFCERIDMLYVPMEHEMRKYKNIFCARCNGETSFNPRCPYTPPLDNTEDLITIISYKVTDIDPDRTESINDLETTRKSRCPRNYRFDPLVTECMPLFCSPPLYLDVTTSTCTLFHQSVSNVKTCHSFYVTFDTSVTIGEAQTIVGEFRTKIFHNRRMFTCRIKVFYQTNSVDANGYTGGGIWESMSANITIKGMYLMIYNIIRKANPGETYTESASIIYDYLSLNHTNISMNVLRSDGFDPNVLRQERTDAIANLTYEAFMYNKEGEPSHYVFVNPYDGTIIIGHVEHFFAYCVANIYKEDFIACPTFMYELTSSFTRIPDGVTVNYSGENIHFSFDEFKSVNASTVRICSQAVIDKVYRSSYLTSGAMLYKVALLNLTLLLIIR